MCLCVSCSIAFPLRETSGRGRQSRHPITALSGEKLGGETLGKVSRCPSPKTHRHFNESGGVRRLGRETYMQTLPETSLNPGTGRSRSPPSPPTPRPDHEDARQGWEVLDHSTRGWKGLSGALGASASPPSGNRAKGRRGRRPEEAAPAALLFRSGKSPGTGTHLP